MKYGISELIIQKLVELFANYLEIKKVILYGSRAKGTFKEGSDIDLTIDSDSLTYLQLLKIENQLDELNLPYKIDLSILRMIENEALVQHIVKYGIILYDNTNELPNK